MSLACSTVTANLHANGERDAANSDDYRRSMKYERATKETTPEIPAPEIFIQKDTGDQSASANPNTVQCAIHLELLAAFHALRRKILADKDIDRTFGVRRAILEVTDGRPYRLRNAGYTMEDMLNLKWDGYLQFATIRFLKWVGKLGEIFSENDEEMQQICNDNLPPLDVLLIWHSFLLNTKMFRENCQGTPLFELAFPWEEIHRAINNSRQFDFILSLKATKTFKKHTGLEADLLKELRTWGKQKDTCDSYLATELRKWKAHEKRQLPSWNLNTVHLISVNRHLRAFVDHNCQLAYELRKAVGRQADFVDKMATRLWLRSPAVQGTLQRAIDRYDKFITLFKLYPYNMFVPTLDIDLVWHTHQCDATGYIEAMKTRVGRIIDHDDRVTEAPLGYGLKKTKEVYRARFGEDYLVCDCWDCQALFSAIEEQMAKGGKINMRELAKKVEEDVSFYRYFTYAVKNNYVLPGR